MPGRLRHGRFGLYPTLQLSHTVGDERLEEAIVRLDGMLSDRHFYRHRLRRWRGFGD